MYFERRFSFKRAYYWRLENKKKPELRKNYFFLIQILALESLGKKHPGRDVIKKTGLGLILNDYRKHNDENVKEAASKVYRKVLFLNLIWFPEIISFENKIRIMKKNFKILK